MDVLIPIFETYIYIFLKKNGENCHLITGIDNRTQYMKYRMNDSTKNQIYLKVSRNTSL